VNWQPIDTAPQDGSDVLVYDGYDVHKAKYEEGRGWMESSFDQSYAQDLFHDPILWMSISDLLKLLEHL